MSNSSLRVSPKPYRQGSATPLRRWSDGQIETVLLAFEAIRLAWSKGWFSGNAKLPAVRIVDLATGLRQEMKPLCDREGASLWCSADALANAAVAAYVFDDASGWSSAKSDWVTEGLQACVDDLHTRCMKAFGVPEKVGDELPLPFDTDYWSGAVAFDLLGDSGLLVALSGKCVETFLAGKGLLMAGKLSVPLESLTAGLATESIQLETRLKECTLDLKVLSGMVAGDVICLSHRLEEPLDLCRTSGAMVARAYLARRNETMVLELAHADSHGTING